MYNCTRFKKKKCNVDILKIGLSLDEFLLQDTDIEQLPAAVPDEEVSSGSANRKMILSFNPNKRGMPAATK